MSDSTRDDGGPAFPILSTTQFDPGRPGCLDSIYSERGMTLRDYFAAKAMQAAATNPVGADGFTFEQRAAWAYQQADAMLTERRQP
jgi:hypothetical protein